MQDFIVIGILVLVFFIKTQWLETFLAWVVGEGRGLLRRTRGVNFSNSILTYTEVCTISRSLAFKQLPHTLTTLGF